MGWKEYMPSKFLFMKIQDIRAIQLMFVHMLELDTHVR
jgi:hypothetical protein